MRPESETYLKWESFSLNDKNRVQILVPPKFGNAHLIISDTAIFHYKQSTLYQGQSKQFTVKWDDPKVGAYWPINNPILSERDQLSKYL
jgi:dTDP-4-dehydrorhamnose 3,5-epimerase